MTHDDACRAVVRWFLTLRWCAVAIDEISGSCVPYPVKRPADRFAPGYRAAHNAWFDAQKRWNASPEYGGGQLDVLAISRPEIRRPRIAIAEIKVSRSDLLADLRARKMLRYQVQATHVYLALGPEIAPTTDDAIEAASPLPPHWGVLRIGKRGSVYQHRKPSACPVGPDPSPDRLNRLAWKIAKSAAYRRLNDAETIRALSRESRSKA